MRQSQKKILIHNVMAFVLIVCGVVMLGVKDNALNLTVQRDLVFRWYSLLF